MSRLVIKLGTSVLTGGTKQLHKPAMLEIVRQCAQLRQAGYEIILCSSGAVAAGRERLGFPDLPTTLPSKQLFAAVGQSRLMLTWERLFEIYGLHVGQILLTRADLELRNRYLNARDTLQALLEYGIIPIINENDAVATEEIRVGDNDNLSAVTAVLAQADLLIMLTDQPGLFTADPRTHPDAQLIREVSQINDDLRQLAGASGTTLGTGGMVTKLQAAAVARRAGAEVVIAAGKEPNVLTRLVLGGEAIGTHFAAEQNPLESRKQWLLAGAKPTGQLIVDGGAVTALVNHGRSLLPAGILHVQGKFGRGDTLIINGQDGREVGRGLARYNSTDLRHLLGAQSSEIEARLGYTYGAAVVHRNDLVLTGE